MKRIVNICLCGTYTEGLTYQDNLLPKYHHRLGLDTFVIASTDEFTRKGDHRRVPEQRYINKDGVFIVRIDSDQGYRVADRFRTYSKLMSILEELNPDIIFQHGPQFTGSKIVAGYVKERDGACRLLVDSHADYSNSARNLISKYVLHRVIWRHYARMLEPYAEKFWGVLPARVDFLVENYDLPKEKCDLLVMGADDDEVLRASQPALRVATREKFGVVDGDFLIVTGGKIDLAKSQTLLLVEAISAIGNNFKLLVFGPVAPELNDEFEKHLQADRIFHIDWATSAEAYDYFSAADLVCFPGRHSVYWEQAAAMGKPLLVKRWSGTTHVDFGDNIAYTSGDDVASIKADVLACAEPTTNARMKAAARAASSMFLYSDIARKSIECGSDGTC